MSQLKEKSILLGGAVNSIMNYLDISNFHLIAKSASNMNALFLYPSIKINSSFTCTRLSFKTLIS